MQWIERQPKTIIADFYFIFTYFFLFYFLTFIFYFISNCDTHIKYNKYDFKPFTWQIRNRDEKTFGQKN